jgi:hypothetical protein
MLAYQNILRCHSLVEELLLLGDPHVPSKGAPRNEELEGETAQKIAIQDSRIKDLEDRLRSAGLWDSCD